MSCWSTSLTLRADAELKLDVLNTPEFSGVSQIRVEVAIADDLKRGSVDLSQTENLWGAGWALKLSMLYTFLLPMTSDPADFT